MKRKLKSLLSVVLSVVMLSSVVPATMVSAEVSSSIVKDDMDWASWSGANYLEGRSYYVGELTQYNTWSGYTGRSGQNAKHWLSDSNTTDSNYAQTAIDYRIYPTRGDTSIAAVTPPSNGGAWGYVGHNYERLSNVTDKSTIPDELWLGVHDLSAYKDTGYVVFKTQAGRTPVQYDDLYFAITAAADNKSFAGYESNGISLPVTKEGNEDATWKEHYAAAVAGVKLTDYYDVEAGYGQTVVIPLSRFVDNPDFLEFGSRYYNKLEELYAIEDYKLNLQLFSGMGIAKRDREKALFSEVRYEDLAIIALDNPENLKAAVDGSRVTLSWDSTDSDAEFVLSKTVNGKTEEIEIGSATTYVDVAEEVGEYTYSVKATAPDYGIESKVSNEVTVTLDSVSEVTRVIKEDIDWENWLKQGAEYSSYLDCRTMYVSGDSVKAIEQGSVAGGPTNIWNDFQWWCGGAGTWKLIMNDPDYTENCDGDIAKYTLVSGAMTDVPTSDGVLWGYKGSKYYTDTSELANTIDKIPEDRWMGVKDISEYEEDGYFVYEISIDSVGYDADNAYLAVEFAADKESIGLSKNDTLPATKDKYPDNTAKWSIRNSVVLGVKLTDYYDMSKRGQQRLYIPISEFTQNYDFKEAFAKATGTSEDDFYTMITSPVDLRLFAGMGIAKKDSQQEEPLPFQAKVYDLQIASVKTPTGVNAELGEDGKVKVTWNPTTDIDVVYNLYRKTGTKAELIYTGSSVEYTDEIATNGVYSYYVVASHKEQTALVSKASEAAKVTFISGESTQSQKFKYNFFWDDTRNGNPANFYIGERDSWGNYGVNNTYGAEFMGNYVSLAVNDYGFGDSQVAEIRASEYTGKKWNKQNWGFAGVTNDFMSLAETPEEFWCDIYDITPIKDYGYAVFEIEPTVTEGIDTAYLAITAPKIDWAIAAFQYNGLYTTDFTPATHPKPQNSDIYCTLVSGVKLTDYYDVAKGGRQTVAVPLSRFLDSPDFMDSFGKSWGVEQDVEVTEETKLNPEYFNGMGIIREDNDAVNALGFKAKVYTMGIFAPQVPSGLSAEVADNGDVELSWAPTSDSDTSYRIARTNQGETTYINVGKEMSYTDTGLNPGNYTYSIAAIDDTCGMVSAESEAIAVKSIGAETDPNKYKFGFNYGGINGEHTARSYYVGNKNAWNDYGEGGTSAVTLHTTSMSVTLNDTGYDPDSVVGEIRTSDYTGKNWGDANWGWAGLNIDVMGDYSSDLTKVPDKFWGDVLDISEYQYKGYAVFKINVTNMEGINDAYFTLTAPVNEWAIPGYTGGDLAITKENYPGLVAQQHYCTLISGVKMTDYYDVTEGGEQVVAIPLNKFVENPAFFDTYGKAWNKENNASTEVSAYTEFKLNLFSGMGIARRISEDAGIMPLGFNASITAMSIVNLFTPSELTAVKGEESVTLSWFETSDVGVSYQLIKTSKDGTEYIDVGTKTSYIDTNVKQGRTYSYQVVAVDSIGAKSLPSAAVTADFPYVTGINVYTGTGDEKQEATQTVDGAMTVEFYCPGQAANGYVAVYDENKYMTQYIPLELTGVEEWIPVEVATTSADTLKAFLWDDDMNPLVEDVVIEPDEVSVALMSAAPQIKNVIYMIPDGAGFALFDFANGVKNEGGYSCPGYGNNTKVEKGDMFMKDYLIGTIKTYCANSAITDSAAAGTALSSGYKTNGATVGLDPDGKPHATLAETFQLMGKKTGLIATVEWPHATPASFAAHVTHRDNYTDIAAQMINQELDLVLPIGFTDKVQYGTSTNKEFTKRGYTVVNTLADIQAIEQGDRVWGGRPWYASDMYSDATQADLAEMTEAAIRALDGTEEGFFLMVEGSNVDGGGHQNDNLLSTSEYLAFDKAFQIAVEYAKGRNDTIVVAAPDHDTGGLHLPGCTDTLTGGQPDYSQYLDAVQTVCSGTKDKTLAWTSDSHTARNCGLWVYAPEGIALPEGTAEVPGDCAETRAIEIENTDIAPWIASVTGTDLDKATEELFVDVTDMGTYDKATQIFTFNDYDVQVKKNEAYAIINGEYVDLDGQVCIRPVSRFYVPKLLFESIRPIITEVDETRYWDAESEKALVKGKVDKTLAGQDVMLIVENKTDSDDVAYIDQFEVHDDGSYVCWFSMDEDIANYDVKVKVGIGDIATDAIVEASTVYEWLDSAVTVEIEDGIIETEVAINNYAGLEGLTFDMLVMFYDENGRLMSCVKGDTTDIVDGINYGFHDVEIADGAVYAKFAVWSGSLGGFPISTVENIDL